MTSPATALPTDTEALKTLVLEQRAKIESMIANNLELTAKALKFQDLYFGKSSEKTRPAANPDGPHQVPLFQAELLAEAQQAAEANNVSGSMSSTPGKSRRKGGRRSKFPKHFPRVETKYELKGEKRRCDCGCGGEMHFR